MPKRIGPRRPKATYVALWREFRGLTQKQLSERLDVSEMTVSRWETRQTKPNTDVLAAIAEALSCEPGDLYHPPPHETVDSLLRDQPPEVVAQAINLIRAIRR